MRVLVTGGAGFIGSHIVDALIAKQHQVFVIDNLSSGQTANVHPGAIFYNLDITSPDAAKQILEIKPEAMIHLAAQIDVRRSVANPAEDARINVLGSLNIISSAVSAGCKKILFASTGGAMYGEADVVPTPESYLAKPISPYGVAKLAVEQYLYFFHVVYGIQTTVLRFANVYGPRQNALGEAGVVSIFCDTILRGHTPKIYGDGTQTRDYIFVIDVVAAVIMALEAEENDIFNVGTGIETDVNTLAKLTAQALGYSGEFTKEAPRSGEQKRSALKSDKIQKALGWQAQIPLEVGLQKTATWFTQMARKKK